ncbi:hypothetical protein IHQ68_08235 [Chelatococcus sambhunathii]|uniref:Uncharacterized protein n=1 Tax=Chelatococcus sambhunathii TaxID=363953 RepID=A0ABU1DF18_9HYPH|nr:hypothetical protein [Chelatococcus sambhunathii]MDR4306604.1 hypothetical protein [Chelatococcus sambhunathii]
MSQASTSLIGDTSRRVNTKMQGSFAKQRTAAKRKKARQHLAAGDCAEFL